MSLFDNFEFIFNYEEYSLHMENQKKKENLTGTIVDYMTEEQLQNIKNNKNFDLSEYDPTPQNIKIHFEKVNKIYSKLIKEHPNDVLLKELSFEENLKYKYFTNWYERYEY